MQEESYKGHIKDKNKNVDRPIIACHFIKKYFYQRGFDLR